MGRSKKFGRRLDGVLILDKPAGVTSNGALQRCKRLFFANKAGHTGSLDPLATGVLPICFGESTKFSQFLLDSDKAYQSTFRFGLATATADSEGEVIAQVDASAVTKSRLQSVMASFRGEIQQLPPMYSAIKKDGRPLYELARKGIEVERKPRAVTLFEFELLDFRPGVYPEADVYVSCSKGTYIRSLAADIGHMLGVGGHVSVLRRTKVGPFSLSDSQDFTTLENVRGEQQAEVLDKYLLPVDAAIADMPSVALDDNSGFYFSRGQSVMANQVYRIADEGDTVRVFQTSGSFLGVGEVTGDGGVAPKRLVATKN